MNEESKLQSKISIAENEIKEQRSKLMKETSAEVGKIMLDYLLPLKEEDESLFNVCAELPLKKRHKLETRSFLLRMAFEICTGTDWSEKTKHVAAAVELLLCSMYYTNRVFDEKGGLEVLSKPNNQIIASMITRELASQAISWAVTGLNREIALKILALFEEANKQVYIGQYLDLNQNIYQSNLAQDWQKAIGSYYRRSDLITGLFNEKIVLIGCILGNGTNSQAEAIRSFAKNYGIMMQIVNDISDFVPPAENSGTDAKVPDDAYSDIRHQKLTLPVLWTLINGINKDKFFILDIFESKKRDEKTMLELTIRLTNNGAIDFAEEVASQYARKAKEALAASFGWRIDLLKNMCFVAYSNRYYKVLQKYKK